MEFFQHAHVQTRGASPPIDQYFKAALMINTLRSIVNDDDRWWALLHDFYQHFKYQNIMTEDVVEYFNHETGKNLTPFFNQYLRHTAIPTLELKFDEPAVIKIDRVHAARFQQLRESRRTPRRLRARTATEFRRTESFRSPAPNLPDSVGVPDDYNKPDGMACHSRADVRSGTAIRCPQ